MLEMRNRLTARKVVKSMLGWEWQGPRAGHEQPGRPLASPVSNLQAMRHATLRIADPPPLRKDFDGGTSFRAERSLESAVTI
ncbi:hypothetical protein N7532_006165 [Penicillium argentinense]|uniref:Uncharacterized protein n=1 Tax=Penicillium argentinense TaxID=1131581 RepID=A0A9W9KAI0_9EURO|nr:uncharacterized protein N7532_006165 [Penicillium argentinense]KAJ5099164.1 hypothetical protein N7532_006165 [Penicillium argentinense]